MVIGFFLMRIIIIFMVIKVVNFYDIGLLLGLNVISEVFMRIIVFGIGIFMFLNYGWSLFGILGSIIDFGVVVILMVKGLK